LYHSKYSGKVLLFGEYTILCGGHALVCPFPKFFAQWEDHQRMDLRLLNFIHHVKKEIKQLSIVDPRKLEHLENKIKSGLVLKTNIPLGKGLGSSGSVCAAVLMQCISDNRSQYSLNTLRENFSIMESYFHGKSSGVDPLIPFIEQSILINNDFIKTVNLSHDNLHVYIYDSEIERKTKPLVTWFQKNMQLGTSFSKSVHEMKEVNNSIINDLVLKQGTSFSNIKHLSQLQFDAFKELIPPTIRLLWKNTFNKSNVSMKLCGAGGGGCFLYLSNKPLTNKKVKELKLNKL